MRNIPMTSLSQDWRTPKSLYQALDAEFGFVFDPCPCNGKEPLPFDGLAIEWASPAYINPPFKGIEKWVRKAYGQFLEGKTCVLLIPSRTDTRWWHNYIMKASEIRFIKGRLKYEGAKFDAPFPSCIIVFKP